MRWERGVRSGSGGMPSVHSRLHILLSYFSRSIPLSFLSFPPFLSFLRKSIFFLLFFLYSYLFPFHSISFSLSILLLLFVPSFPVALLRAAPPSRQDNLSLSFSALPLSVPRSPARLYARLAGSKTIRAFLSHFHITRRSRSCSCCGSLKADLQRSDRGSSDASDAQAVSMIFTRMVYIFLAERKTVIAYE